MHPELVTIFGRTIYWYGVMTALGFLAAVASWSWLGKRDGRPNGLASELGIWVMVGGILGARIAFIIANWDDYAAAPLDMLRIDKGGLIYYGGFIGGVVSILLMAVLRREPILRFGDFVITSVPLGHGLGRIGCLLNGCCMGKACSLPWAVRLGEAAPVHPTPIYETLYNLLVYAALVWMYRGDRRPGRVIALYLILYPIGRFLFEFTRGDERMQWLGLTVAQDISIGLFIAGCALWFLLPRKKDHA